MTAFAIGATVGWLWWVGLIPVFFWCAGMGYAGYLHSLGKGGNRYVWAIICFFTLGAFLPVVKKLPKKPVDYSGPMGFVV